ncbi:CdaR family transcriptional regulator [Salisediminibacterium halotolerans]|uniref:CdaR family transcriptional regulator n=1 Tax=Salisediminibacterium halotolerans TaxID=517425 RepID=UPI000EB03B4B|nr:sugar diacid recognition domain-containing protein [Salisediminibacterium halotolerans]RLJ78195.1 carbohydrate diacid regulator [Actinophytocola xinjiangensis]RPE88466.1 CdaR family transcriptional regulator [Salisediminibacterium halotolerans]TWG37172.1 carbohydrate diacid regulator [Salisediminibacterium halotolerans]GEL08999.1 carbohydrate diacid regulator [Salisediminibacterium halotolerans]
MNLLTTLAQRIVQEVTDIVQEEVIVCDESGIIAAASDKSRINMFHEGAELTVQDKEKLIITEDDVHKLQGVKPGLNLPIMMKGSVIGVIGITGKPENVLQFGQLIQRMTELIVQEAYSSERLDSKYRGLETFIYEWVNIQVLDEEFIERGEILGIQMSEKRKCVLIEVLNTTDATEQVVPLDQELSDLFREHLDMSAQEFIVPWGNGRFIFLHSTERKDGSYFSLRGSLERCQRETLRRYHMNIAVGIGQEAESPSKLYRSYFEAKRAMQAAKKTQKPTFYEELTLDIALSEVSDTAKETFVNRVLGSLRHDDELLETLMIYIKENQHLKNTARRLHIHINTLHYRLKKIETLTGSPVKQSDTFVSLYLALLFLRENL